MISAISTVKLLPSVMEWSLAKIIPINLLREIDETKTKKKIPELSTRKTLSKKPQLSFANLFSSPKSMSFFKAEKMKWMLI
ncbi:MAG: hypothetical protein QM764_21655 [Chitinophagaceae bacterium]